MFSCFNYSYMTNYSWKSFVQLLSKQSQIPIELRTAQLSQAILESGRGNSVLFKFYGNPYGMKYRSELKEVSTPIKLEVSNGIDVYCCFPTEKIAVGAYWMFLNRSVYAGWEKMKTSEDFVRFLLACGYAGDDKNHQQDYFSQISKILPEASHILQVV